LTLLGNCRIVLGKTRREVQLSEAATTNLSSKGQVVIPEEIRDRLGLKPGAQFVVRGDRDVVKLRLDATMRIMSVSEGARVRQ
jgi:AbrB family looped-hinge helix DNA binding protein